MYPIERLRQEAVHILLRDISYYPICVNFSILDTLRFRHTNSSERVIRNISIRLVEWCQLNQALVRTYVEYVSRERECDEVSSDFIMYYLGNPNLSWMWSNHFFHPEGENDVYAHFIEDVLIELDSCVQSFRMPRLVI